MPLATESIPISKDNHRSDHSNDFVSTPDGAMYSTTPGGTRIIYDRLFLLRCRDSPLAKTPPPNLPDIPGITTPNRPPNQQIRQKMTENPGEHTGPEMSPNQRYEAPHFFQFPQVYDVNNNMPNVHSRFIRPTFGGPLAQYRQRQTVQANPSPHLMFQPRFNLPPGPQIGAEHCGMFSPVPLDHSSPFGLPIPFMHPMQGPAAPVFNHQPKMSQLAVWRRTHARPGDPAALGYTTAKAPQLRSSFEQDAEHFHPGPGIRRLSSGYSSQHDSFREQSSLVMTIPDDPSIIAYKPSHLKA